jgi:hypothetical protein
MADQIPQSVAVKCIIGEAENQGEAGINALSHALYNRGTTKGVYGCSRHVKTSEKVARIAGNAWESVSYTDDPTNGATHWGNKDDMRKFKKMKWFKKAYDFVTIKDHTFFKVRD